MKNHYQPIEMAVEQVTVETEDKNIKTFTLRFIRQDDKDNFLYLPGQFAMLSLWGKGEAAFGIASSPAETGMISFSINKIGLVTGALHAIEAGDHVWMRGPFGNHYPVEKFVGQDILIIGGGYAFTTLRSLTEYILKTDRQKFGQLSLLYGARTPGLFLYKEELSRWKKRDDMDLTLTIDKPAEGWDGQVGVVPGILKTMAPDPQANVVVCGPPVMIKYTLPVLKELGISPHKTFLSLEMKMKCGVGICGRCNIGPKYVCKDGPVFTLAELDSLPQE